MVSRIAMEPSSWRPHGINRVVGTAGCLTPILFAVADLRSFSFLQQPRTETSASSIARFDGHGQCWSSHSSSNMRSSSSLDSSALVLSSPAALLVLAAAVYSRNGLRSGRGRWSQLLRGVGVATPVIEAQNVHVEPEEMPEKDAFAWGAFTDWITSRGGDVSKVRLAQIDGLRGLVATQDIAEGESIVEIPIGCSIELQSKVDSSDPSIPALEMLRVWREGTDQGGRDVKPYLDLVPPIDSNDISTMPDFFTDVELDMLQCPPVVAKTKKRQELCKMRAKEHGVSARDLKWALCTVSQRSFTVNSPFDGLLRLLLPAIDMFNHCAEAPHGLKVVWQLEGLSDGRFKVVAGNAVNAGEEVRICYGGNPYRADGCGGDCKGDSAWTNDQYLQRYGFHDTSIGTLMTDGKWLVSEETAPIREALEQTTVAEDETLLAATDLPVAARAAVGYRLSLKRALVAQRAADESSSGSS